jgi:hypothetical protein
MLSFWSGNHFIPAQKVMVPAGPNVFLSLGVAIGAGLTAGIWLALLFPPARRARSDGLAIVGEDTCEPFQDRKATDQGPDGGANKGRK